MTTYPSAPVDQPTQDTLDLLNVDPSHRTDRVIIAGAIETVAARNGGTVDPNELRREVTGLVQPNVIGSTINALARSGRLEAIGWTVTEGSASRNDGKPCRVYRLHPQTHPGSHHRASFAVPGSRAPGGGGRALPSSPLRPAAPH